MKKLYFLLLSALVFAFASCTKDQTTDAGGNDSNQNQSTDYVYLDVALSLPTAAGTRSTTENDNEGTNNGTGDTDGKTPSDATKDYEVGWDYENAVNSLILVIADESDNFLLYSAVNSLSQMTPNASDDAFFDVTSTAKFSRNELKKFYDDNTVGNGSGTNKKIRLYAFCNYTADLETLFEYIADNRKTGDYQGAFSNTTGTDPNASAGSWLNWVAKLTETANGSVTSSIWGKNSFLMTNAVVVEAQLPETIDSWNNYTSPSTPFKLSGSNANGDPDNSGEEGWGGPIKVERAAARLDFKDVTTEDTPATYPLTGSYSVVSGGAVTTKDVNLFTIQLTDMSLVNMSNGYFFVRRVSDDGTNDTGGNKWRIGRYETTTNYVVDHDFEWKKTVGGTGTVTATQMADHFNFPLFNVPTGGEPLVSRPVSGSADMKIYGYNRAAWSTTSIATLLNSQENDNWNDRHDYKIWRYVTENTIPKVDGEGVDAGSAQKAGVSTGIVFTGKITAGDDIDAVYAQNGDVNTTARFVSEDVKTLLAAPNADKPLYLFNGLLYATLAEITEAAYNDGPGSRAHNVVSDILKYWYLEYTEEYETDGEFDPAKITSDVTFKYAATTPMTEGKKYLPLTVEIYYALTTTKEDAFDEVLKKDADGERGENGENVWKAEDTYHKTFMQKKANIKFQTGEGEATAAFDESAIEFVNLAVKNFTIYRATTLDGTAPLGYYCYYFYWNRHNNNGNNSLMGPMEFATVRNNVYKLSVKTVGRIGHPTIPTDDPDPIIPDTPDEDDDIYMSVELEVLPWVVRVNEIEF